MMASIWNSSSVLQLFVFELPTIRNFVRRPMHSWNNDKALCIRKTAPYIGCQVTSKTEGSRFTKSSNHIKNYQHFSSQTNTKILENAYRTLPQHSYAQQRNSSNRMESKKKLEDDEANLGLVQKFKLMYKKYWYVLLPVHCATSVVWYGSFFFAAKSGIDIVPMIEYLGVSDKYVSYLKGSDAGYYAVAYAMYKISTPARYTVTVGGTTIAINYLKERGHIKPVPSREELQDMYEDKKEELLDRREEMIGKYQEKKDELLDRREEMIGKYQEKKDEILDKREEMMEKYHEKKEEIYEKYQEKRKELEHTVSKRSPKKNK